MRGDLGLLSVVAFGVAYMAPAVVTSIFGVIAATSRGAAPTAYVIATGAMLLTGLSYAKMARLHPSSGSVYTYARKELDSRIGFLAGWALLLDYLFLPMVAWLLQAVYLHAQFPAVPEWAWLVINVSLATGINVIGLKTADRINRVLLVGVTATLVILAVLCVHYGSGHGGTPAATHAFWNNTTSLSAVTAAAAVAAYAFLGFDAVSTLSEEVHDPRRTIPRSIVLTVLTGGAIFIVISFLMQWAHPGGAFPDENSAGYLVSTTVGGQTFADVANIISMLGGFASCVAIQASTSRLMFVMGRDGALPRQIFGRLHRKLLTPVTNVLIIGLVGLLAMNLSLADATSFINFGAFLSFTLVNLCVIAYAVRQWRSGTRHSRVRYFLLPVAGAAVDVYLITQLGSTAVELGLGWLAIGIAWLAVVTTGFRRPAPELQLKPAAEDGPARAESAGSVRPTP
ncbi:APC family permease [Streptomyces iranensis]|uniref:Amino acid transporter n=1 Tax=Streptomyces iranensis TaxID=576784 RepID=A0A061ACM0_9ACTN|nr:APC family permease [Streptomyces iranensis]MBP2067621.1 amino acid transporter [Streptomyces iranensis]CDR18176.1 amino acid transporter [Streptomyces iranensis]